jgi:hypothetical protein
MYMLLSQLLGTYLYIQNKRRSYRLICILPGTNRYIQYAWVPVYFCTSIDLVTCPIYFESAKIQNCMLCYLLFVMCVYCVANGFWTKQLGCPCSTFACWVQTPRGAFVRRPELKKKKSPRPAFLKHNSFIMQDAAV